VHRLFTNNLIRSEWKNRKRPILINNWEATYFNFNDAKLYNIAKDAAGLGIEMLVMDDGWFGHRNDDTTSLGDWFVNPSKIQRGLGQLVRDINTLGLGFGIWFEPEMVSEDSDLFKAHPDWAFVIPGRKPILSRAQLVLDMTRSDVRDHLFKVISDVLRSANITYVKWDMNRHLTDLYSAMLPRDRQGEIYHRYVLGLYDLLERVTAAFPHILLEGCSGGGGRFDAGMLYYAPQSWLSDDTDAIERLKIQFGSSLAYPVSSFGAHVSVVPNHQTGRSVPMTTRGVVAMTGTFGYELDITQVSAEDKTTIKALNAKFHKYYDVIHGGDLYRLVSPFENPFYCAWLFVSPDKRTALLNVVQILARPIPPLVVLTLQGLEPDRLYTISRYPGRTFSGSALMNAGICLEWATGDGIAWQYEIGEVVAPKAGGGDAQRNSLDPCDQ
jgi:alpha-galactosidase